MIVVMKPGATPAADRPRHRADRAARACAATSSSAPSAPSSPPWAKSATGPSRPWKRERGSKKWSRSWRPTRWPAPRSRRNRTVVQARGPEGRRTGHRRHRRALLRRKPAADPGDRPCRQGGRRRRPARRRLQAAHQPVQLPGPEGEGPGTAGRGPRRDRPGRRHRGDGPRARAAGRAATPTCCRSAPATCRTIRCWRRSAKSGLPVLLKRGPSATMDEFLLAAEYILKTGNTQVMLCERGIRTFEDHTRFTLPLATVPYLHQNDAPAGGGRSQPRHRQGEPGGGRWPGPPWPPGPTA